MHYFLGIEVTSTPLGTSLSQQKYIHDLLVRHDMLDANDYLTPMTSSLPLTKHSGTPLPSSEQYRQVVGALQYATFTRPDIAFAVNKMCQFMLNPTTVH